MPGVEEAALMMATPANKGILRRRRPARCRRRGGRGQRSDPRGPGRYGTRRPTARSPRPRGRARQPRTAAEGGGTRQPRTLRAALRSQPAATLALISVPGDYAAAEARKALRAGST